MSEANLIDKLRAAMNRRGVSIKDAARMCNIHVDTLERLLGGRTRKLDAQMIDRIATIGMTVIVLLLKYSTSRSRRTHRAGSISRSKS
jgi:transcriptional regulator with XRE-family HTH domain